MRYLKTTNDWPKIAVYDIEAENWVDAFLFCHWDEYGNKVSFATVGEYVDWLFEEFEGSHVWAHFGGRYDHRFLIPEFYRRGYDMKAALSGGSIVILTVQHNGKKLLFCDSYRLMPSSLKSIGKTIKLEKIDVDRTAMTQLKETDPELALAYCFRDCEIVMKGLQLMRTTLTSVNADFAFTLASIATRYVRRSPVIEWERFYKPKEKGKGLQYDDMMSEVDAWCEPARHGGRTEMFAQGETKGPIYYYDIVSSYPYAMTKELPLYFLGFFPPPTKQTDSALIEYLSYCGVTEATVTIPKCRVGPLPFVHNERLLFPHGKLTGRWTNIELLAAFRRGCKIEPHYQCRFTSKAFLRPFVNTFYALRKKAKAEGDEFRTYAFKILLNSLYGKLGETIDRSSYTTSRIEIQRARENRRAQLRQRGHKVADNDPVDVDKATKIAGLWQLSEEEEGPFRHVAAGAYVTAYARLRLLEGIENVISKGGDIIYCDTDSIMSTVELPEIVGPELGEWNHEYTLSQVEILLPKVYRSEIQWPPKKVGVEYRCKGIPIVRENDKQDEPELRWQAYKLYAETTDPDIAKAMVAMLANDGMTGFVEDIRDGSIDPRSKSRAGKALIRKKTSIDRKRDWSEFPSTTLRVEAAVEFAASSITRR